MPVDVYISAEKIENRVKELAEQINRDYAGKDLLLVGVLTGAFIFCADLMRRLNVAVNIEFISASSYGDGTTSSGNVKINLDLNKDIVGKDVLIIEDIVDSGLTVTRLMEMFKARNPRSIRLATLLFKKVKLIHPVKIDYMGFEIPDVFVVGLGLDYAGHYRELPYIGVYRPN